MCIYDVDCCFGLLTLLRRFMLHLICFLSMQTKIIYDIYMLANLYVTRLVSTEGTDSSWICGDSYIDVVVKKNLATQLAYIIFMME